MIAYKNASPTTTLYLPSAPKTGVSLYAIPGLGERRVQGYFIFQKCLKYFDISEEKIKGKSRKAEVIIARHITMWFLVTRCKMTLTAVGEMFGGKDHTTVLNAKRSVEDQLSVRYDNKIKMHIRHLNVILW